MHIKYDTNGNKVLAITASDLAGARGFHVQTLYHLPKTHKDGLGAWTDEELREYLKEHGTKRQKELFGIY